MAQSGYRAGSFAQVALSAGGISAGNYQREGNYRAGNYRAGGYQRRPGYQRR
jgi:hypothetical protein